MPDTQGKYDIEFLEGELGDDYDITIKEDDGSLADITWATYALLDILAFDGIVKAAVPNTELTIISASNKLRWAMKSDKTSGYNGEHIAYVTLQNAASSPTRKKITKRMSVFVYPKG